MGMDRHGTGGGEFVVVVVVVVWGGHGEYLGTSK